MSNPQLATRREVWSGIPKGSLDPRLTDLYAGRIRAFVPPGFQGLLVPNKEGRRILRIPFGTQVPIEGLDGLRDLETDKMGELLDLFRELGHTLPIFRSDPERFQAQNDLLAVHRVGFTRTEGVFVLV